MTLIWQWELPCHSHHINQAYMGASAFLLVHSFYWIIIISLFIFPSLLPIILFQELLPSGVLSQLGMQDPIALSSMQPKKRLIPQVNWKSYTPQSHSSRIPAKSSEDWSQHTQLLARFHRPSDAVFPQQRYFSLSGWVHITVISASLCGSFYDSPICCCRIFSWTHFSIPAQHLPLLLPVTALPQTAISHNRAEQWKMEKNRERDNITLNKNRYTDKHCGVQPPPHMNLNNFEGGDGPCVLKSMCTSRQRNWRTRASRTHNNDCVSPRWARDFCPRQYISLQTLRAKYCKVTMNKGRNTNQL